MWWYYTARWLIFLVAGIPLQQLTNVLWPLACTWFWFCVRGKYGVPLTPPPARFTTDQLIANGKQDKIINGYYLGMDDDNGAIQQMFLWMLRPELSEGGLKGLVQQDPGPGYGVMMRKNPLEDDNIPPAGDELSSWIAAYVSTGGDKEDLRKAAWHYMKNCMGLATWCNGWQVSSRSSNGGFNWTFDGWSYLNYPAIPPQYFTTAALLRVAARDLSILWWIPYFFNFWIMGGWMAWAMPFGYVPGNSFYYSQQITLLNLRSLALTANNPLTRAMFRWSIRYIVIHCAPQGNCDPIFYGLAAATGALTEAEIDRALLGIVAMKPEWPQNDPYAASFYDAGMDSPYFSTAGATAQELLKAKAKFTK